MEQECSAHLTLPTFLPVLLLILPSGLRGQGFCLRLETNFVSPSMLSKSVTPSRFCIPLKEVLKADHSGHHKVVDLLSIKRLLFFLQACAEKYCSSPLEKDTLTIWASVQILLTGRAMALQPHVRVIQHTAIVQECTKACFMKPPLMQSTN